MADKRQAIGALSLSAMALVMWVTKEGWSGTATPPVKGDVPTYGFGTTTHEDGSPVKQGETITPPQAVKRVAIDASRFTDRVKLCMSGAELYQHELDAYVLLAENVGGGNFCNSSIPAKVKAGQYEAACKTILDFKRVQGKDCSQPANRHFCGGVWTARQDEYRLCATGEYPAWMK